MYSATGRVSTGQPPPCRGALFSSQGGPGHRRGMTRAHQPTGRCGLTRMFPQCCHHCLAAPDPLHAEWGAVGFYACAWPQQSTPLGHRAGYPHHGGVRPLPAQYQGVQPPPTVVGPGKPTTHFTAGYFPDGSSLPPPLNLLFVPFVIPFSTSCVHGSGYRCFQRDFMEDLWGLHLGPPCLAHLR